MIDKLKDLINEAIDRDILDSYTQVDEFANFLVENGVTIGLIGTITPVGSIKTIDIKPGDTIVWKIPLGMSCSQAKNIFDTIKKVFPNNAVTAIPGDSDLSVKEENDGN